MKRVAEASGVSVATVSRVFHAPDKVKTETRDKIMRVVEELNYVYNAAASDFSAQRRSKVLGVLVPMAGNSLFGSTLMGIQETAARKGFSVVIGSTGYDIGTERQLLRQFNERRVGGIILTGTIRGNEHLVADMAATGFPLVLIWEVLDTDSVSYVGFDNRRGAYEATRHLLNLGHRRIGLIAGPFSQVRRVRQRLEGYRDSLHDHGVAYDPAIVIERKPTLFEGRSAADKLLSSESPPTAIFAASDFLAIGAMHAIHQRGMRIPEDISVVGFDDVDMAEYVLPPLTTIRVESNQIGHLAAETIIEQALEQSLEPKCYKLETALISRGSCGPPRSS
jgi:DNA-binding LacI/PurR family transcriptional regulator